jgi:shikimate kinase
VPPLNIVLVGFMGTGKSAVGQRLASHLVWEFVDTDERIAAGGRAIAEIFATEGEGTFRDRETAVLRALSESQSTVIATGGGIMGREENVRLLQNLGPLICLTARPEIILERTRPWKDRPLLAAASSPADVVERLLHERGDRYALATLTIDTSDLTIEQVMETICRRLA